MSSFYSRSETVDRAVRDNRDFICHEPDPELLTRLKGLPGVVSRARSEWGTAKLDKLLSEKLLMNKDHQGFFTADEGSALVTLSILNQHHMATLAAQPL